MMREGKNTAMITPPLDGVGMTPILPYLIRQVIRVERTRILTITPIFSNILVYSANLQTIGCVPDNPPPVAEVAE